MTVPSVERLARLAYGYHPDGTREWRAWRALTGAAERGDEAAIEMFYLQRDLVPDNDVDRALFFVLTGHHERYEALDPDGALLAAAYCGASNATREALRHTMIILGELNAARVIADHPDRTLTSAEADYLAQRLAAEVAENLLTDILPSEAEDRAAVYGDSAYGSGELLTRLDTAGVHNGIKVQPPAAVKGQFPKDRFSIDLEARTVTCPAGVSVPIRARERHAGQARFGAACATITITINDHKTFLAAAVNLARLGALGIAHRAGGWVTSAA